jgi:hypothetical protein
MPMQTYSTYHQVTAAFSNNIQKVTTKAVIQTMSDVIIGDLHLRPRLRLIDELISGDQYLAVTNAVVYDKSGRVRFKTSFLTINREHIVLVIPWEDIDVKHDTGKLGPTANVSGQPK